jgi:hypothetical protein
MSDYVISGLVMRRATLAGEIIYLREELKRFLPQGHEFKHRGNLFVYVPTDEQPKPFIIGQVGRSDLREENLPPEQGFRLAQHEARPVLGLLRLDRAD